jgi:hypothetical protein
MKNQIKMTKILNGHLFQITTSNHFFLNGKRVDKAFYLDRLAQECA